MVDGTHGRKWHTDENKNIAFSFLIKADCNIDRLKGLTIEIAEVLVGIFKDLYNIELNIKSPNDIFVNEKKVGGILTESKSQGNIVKYIIVGIGMNLNQIEFDEDIKDIATSIKKEFGIEVDRYKVISEFCNVMENKIIERKVI